MIHNNNKISPADSHGTLPQRCLLTSCIHIIIIITSSIEFSSRWSQMLRFYNHDSHQQHRIIIKMVTDAQMWSLFFSSGHIASSRPDAAEEDEGGSTKEGDFDLVWVKFTFKKCEIVSGWKKLQYSQEAMIRELGLAKKQAKQQVCRHQCHHQCHPHCHQCHYHFHQCHRHWWANILLRSPPPTLNVSFLGTARQPPPPLVALSCIFIWYICCHWCSSNTSLYTVYWWHQVVVSCDIYCHWYYSNMSLYTVYWWHLVVVSDLTHLFKIWDQDNPKHENIYSCIFICVNVTLILQ